MAPSKIKLYYFDSEGRAEGIRMCLRFAGIEFEDIRIPREKWIEEKPKFPLLQVPVLEVDGVMIPQTDAILRYVAQLAKLYPSDAYQALLVDSVISTIETSVFDAIIKWIKTPDSEKDQATKTLMEVDLPECLTRLDKYIATISSGPFIASSVSVADLLLFQFFKSLEQGKLPFCPQGVKGLSAKYLAISRSNTAFAELPNVKAMMQVKAK